MLATSKRLLADAAQEQTMRDTPLPLRQDGRLQLTSRTHPEENMKLQLASAMLLGAALGVGAIEMLHAQSKPPAYLISDITVTDEVGYKEYADKIIPTYAQFGAKFLVRAGQTIAIPGAGEPPKRAIVVMFENLDKAKAWSESDAVKQTRPLRDRVAKLHAYLVEGAQ
jgi:uncharacterized protein (DUF1330 family)